ncbi:hypothetical protein FQA39_LY12815 [Lamprigera yunnana]|nr:hypothetical protein FQA39_LY12815 [Lamprigera yunnana]
MAAATIVSCAPDNEITNDVIRHSKSVKDQNPNVVESEVEVDTTDQYATRGEYSATIKVKEGSTIYEQGEVNVHFH